MNVLITLTEEDLYSDYKDVPIPMLRPSHFKLGARLIAKANLIQYIDEDLCIILKNITGPTTHKPVKPINVVLRSSSVLTPYRDLPVNKIAKRHFEKDKQRYFTLPGTIKYIDGKGNSIILQQTK
jgi:hypothetical protein